MGWGSPIEIETRLRIVLAVAAYAYEMANDPIMSDADFDHLARSVCLDVDTTRPDLDAWFRKSFDPSTGMWVRSHPELDKIRRLFLRVYRGRWVRVNDAAPVARHMALI